MKKKSKEDSSVFTQQAGRGFSKRKEYIIAKTMYIYKSTGQERNQRNEFSITSDEDRGEIIRFSSQTSISPFLSFFCLLSFWLNSLNISYQDVFDVSHLTR